MRIRFLTTPILAGVLSLSACPASGSESLAQFTAITSAKFDNELPAETSGSSASVHRDLRPKLGYPTLQVAGQGSVTLAPATPPAGEEKAATALPLSSEFAQWVKATLGTDLPVYGDQLFDSRGQNFDLADQVNVPNSFILGPGDEINIQAWGSIDIDVTVRVDRNGQIHLPKVGDIAVAGVRFDDLKARIRQGISRVYKGFELSIALGELRSIRIYVTGFASAPGTYTISSLSSLVNAIFLSGGPAPAGDFRSIELRRNNSTITEFDLYAFLMRGDRSQDLRLLPEDLIYIPPLHGQVAIAGAVNQPAIFKTTAEDTIADVIAYAGGVSPAANQVTISLERFTAAGERTVKEVEFTESGLESPVRDGDIIMLKTASPQFTNAVTLRGHVAQPLRHEWRPDMRVADLLPTPEALTSSAYWFMRMSQDTLASASELQPAKLNIDFPDINWNYAAIERINRTNAKAELIPFNLHRAIVERDAEHNHMLQPGDTITVFALGEFAAPVDETRRFVRIEGEVRNAGIYSVTPDVTIRDLVAIAGGLTRKAYLYGLSLERESVRKQQVQRRSEAIDRLDEEYQRHLIERSRNVLSGDLSMAIRPESDAIEGLISRLKAIEPSGRIILDLALKGPQLEDLPELTLRDKDRIYIPPRPETVEIVGAVLQTGSALFEPGKKVSDYLATAGLLETADRGQIYLVRPNGSFIKANSRARLIAGDTLVIPEKVDRLTTTRRLKDWTQVLYQFGLGAAGIKILMDT